MILVISLRPDQVVIARQEKTSLENPETGGMGQVAVLIIRLQLCHAPLDDNRIEGEIVHLSDERDSRLIRGKISPPHGRPGKRIEESGCDDGEFFPGELK